MRNNVRVEMLQLKLIRSHFSCRPDFSGHSGDFTSISISLKNNGEFFDENTRAHFVQSFATNPEAPFQLEVEFAAVFALNESPLPLERRHYISHVFPQLVFPYMQEYVADITRRGGFIPLSLSHNLFNNDDEDERPQETQPPPTSKWTH